MYKCTCNSGFTGVNCETNIDECASNPCLNGNCNNLIGAYNCSCFAGWTGINCNTNIDECLSNPCTNGATCVNGLARWTCTCPAGFMGTKY